MPIFSKTETDQNVSVVSRDHFFFEITKMKISELIRSMNG